MFCTSVKKRLLIGEKPNFSIIEAEDDLQFLKPGTLCNQPYYSFLQAICAFSNPPHLDNEPLKFL